MTISYTTVPKAVYPFDTCDALTRYTFGLILDRWKLSAREETWRKWYDDHGCYCVYDRKELAAELGVTQPTLRRCLDKLIEENLIEVERAEKFGAYRYYLPWRSRQAVGIADPMAQYGTP